MFYSSFVVQRHGLCLREEAMGKCAFLCCTDIATCMSQRHMFLKTHYRLIQRIKNSLFERSIKDAI